MTISSQSELSGMQAIGRVVALALAAMREAAHPGVSTAELDAVAADVLRAHGARSAPQLAYGFPGVTCISINDEIVHGIPGRRILQPRDVVKLDVSAELDGFIADAAITVVMPPVTHEAKKLRRCAEVAFADAMRVARAGVAVNAIGRAVERSVTQRGFHVIKQLTGHGVGRRLHEPPNVPNYFDPLTRGTLTEGLVIAVEPLVSAQAARTIDDRDGWTVRTSNRCLAAHYENTIMITSGEPLVLTQVA